MIFELSARTFTLSNYTCSFSRINLTMKLLVITFLFSCNGFTLRVSTEDDSIENKQIYLNELCY